MTFDKNEWNHKNGKHYNNIWARQSLDLIKKIIGRCQNPACGLTNPNYLQFAHIHDRKTEVKGRGRGRKERLADIRAYPDSYTFFCDDDHSRYDSGELQIQPKSLLELQEEVKVRIFKVPVMVTG